MQTTELQIPTTKGEFLQAQLLLDEKFTGKRPIILVIHGWTSSMRRFPERFQPIVEMGYMCLLFDMRGHGKTGGDLGTYSTKDHLDDCIAAYNFLCSQPNADLTHISVFGNSYGGYLAALVSAKVHVDHLVMSVPANYRDDHFLESHLHKDAEERRQWRMMEHTPEENKALAAVKQFSGDLLFVEAELDEQIPQQMLIDYRKYAPKYDYVMIKGADHSCYNPGTNQLFINELTSWFKEFIVASSLS